MTVTGFLSISPYTEGSMAPEIATAVDALEEFDVAYEMTHSGTTLEADDVDELFAAAQAAHKAVDADRVGTLLKIDDKRRSVEPATEKVDAVERQLGRPARSDDGD